MSSSSPMQKWYRRHVADPFKYVRRQVRRSLRHPRLAMAYHRYLQAVRLRDWQAVRGHVATVAEMAETAADSQLLKDMSISAEQLCEYENATKWGFKAAHLKGEIPENSWNGESLEDATLVIPFMEKVGQGLAGGMSLTGFVREAAQQAHHCILIVEKRLVPIYERSLSEVEVHAFPFKPVASSSTKLVLANPLSLKKVMGTSAISIRERFMPLLPEAGESLRMRDEYLAGRSLPLIGISWWSSHHGKDLPAIEAWAEFVRETEAIFVSLQYGPVASDLEVLRQAAPGRVVVDDTVDQLVNMDRFAAQLGALDAAVTISNSGAHLAGAMGVPVCLIRDDWFRRGWPVLSHETPWHPSFQVLGRDGRSWETVFSEVQQCVMTMVQG